MSESDKDNLENFFRKRAQNHHLEFNEGDWLKMEAQLDKEMPATPSFWSLLKKFYFIPLLLIMLPVFWFTFTKINSPELNSSDNNITRTRLIKPEDRRLIEKENAGLNTTPNSTVNTEKQKIKESTITTTEKNIHSPPFVYSKEKLTTGINTKPKNTIISNIKPENIDEASYAVFENGAGVKGQILYSELHFLLPISPISNLETGNVPELIDENYIPEIVPDKRPASYFSLGIGFSPDFSSVGLGNFVTPGSRWTIQAEYSFLNRLSINTGIVLVNNKYEAYGSDYHAPSAYWKNGIVAEEAYGECKMVDIPLNLRYDIISKPRHKLFVSGGASTYFVLKEDYYFQYEQDDPDLPDYWGTDEMTVYPFGIVNISVGYQYLLGRKGAIQIEPFIKIPTTGIGWGNVDLHTIGTYFIYKYRIGK